MQIVPGRTHYARCMARRRPTLKRGGPLLCNAQSSRPLRAVCGAKRNKHTKEREKKPHQPQPPNLEIHSSLTAENIPILSEEAVQKYSALFSQLPVCDRGRWQDQESLFVN